MFPSEKTLHCSDLIPTGIDTCEKQNVCLWDYFPGVVRKYCMRLVSGKEGPIVTCPKGRELMLEKE